MPRYRPRTRPVCRVAGQMDLLPVELAQELFLLRPILGEAAFGNDHLVIVGQRPEAAVEEPVRILAQGQTIPRIVVARVRELVDVGGIDDAAAGDGGQPIARERTGVVVSRDFRTRGQDS